MHAEAECQQEEQLAGHRKAQRPGLGAPRHRHDRQRRGDEVHADVGGQGPRQFPGLAPALAERGGEQVGPEQDQRQHHRIQLGALEATAVAEDEPTHSDRH